jgi:hypothetical protein
MADRALSIEPISISPAPGIQPQYVVTDRPLDRVLAFTGYGIHDVVNNPIARNAVYGYFKLHRFVQRRCEIIELERQWNPSNRGA